jgi:hypothetical protein
VTVAGVAAVPGRFLELGRTDESGVVWQNLTIERFARFKGLAMQPIVIEQAGNPDDGLVRDWPRPDFGISKHYGYAVQWFSFCGLIIFLYGYFHVRRSDPKTKRMLLLLYAISPAPSSAHCCSNFWKPQSFTNSESCCRSSRWRNPVKARDGSVSAFGLRGKWAFVWSMPRAMTTAVSSDAPDPPDTGQGSGTHRASLADQRRAAACARAGGAVRRHPRVLVEGDEFLRKLPAVASLSDHVYVDPFGNLMMRFRAMPICNA